MNAVGSLALGALTGSVLRHVGSAHLRTVAGTGFCGGLTTWSTASWESIRLVEEGAAAGAARYTVANLAASLVSGAIGLALFLT